jgi:hypothetical protein
MSKVKSRRLEWRRIIFNLVRFVFVFHKRLLIKTFNMSEREEEAERKRRVTKTRDLIACRPNDFGQGSSHDERRQLGTSQTDEQRVHSFVTGS